MKRFKLIAMAAVMALSGNAAAQTLEELAEIVRRDSESH